jgi:hypothetical protein
MLTCFICNIPCAGSLKDLYAHYKSEHQLVERYTQYTCAQGQCNRKFTDKYTFGRHIESQHCDCLNLNSAVADKLVTSNDIQNDDNASGTMDMDINDSYIQSPDRCDFDLKNLAAKYIAEAKSMTSSLSSAHLMVQSCSNMIECMMTDVLNEVQSLRKVCRSEAEHLQVSNLLTKIHSYIRPFDGLESEYMQKKYMEKRGLYVEPQKYVIGSTCGTVLDKKTGVVGPVMTECTGQFISVRSMIETLNSKTDLIKLALMNNTSSDGTLKNYFDGDSWRKHPACSDSQPVVVLKLYGDDFEPGNPLGSHRTLYKLGTIYYQFENLPSYLQSKTDNMFLSLCYHSEDVKAFGWDAVLQPLIKELKELEQGIPLYVNDKLLHVKVIVGAVTGDNLFLNSIFGHTESFTANFPCRHCSMHRDNFQTSFVEDKSMVRTVQSYNADVEKGSVEQTGIKFSSPFNTLQYFHSATNFVQDAMHDILEGICKYDMILVINYVIESKLVSREHLNGLVDNFSYGSHDIKNKPGVLTESALRSEMLYFEAAQTWCFTRIVALLIGDIVPVDDRVWCFYLKLREIMDIIFAPVLCVGELRLLEVLIAEYLQMHTELFPHSRLKNKHHHMIHYPRLIHQFGPIIRFWCMRFESKHQRAKRLMHISGNFKNVPLTVATRHQYDFAYRLLTGVSCDFELTLGRGSVVCLSDLPNGEAINACIGHVGMHFELYQSRSAVVAGTEFKLGCYLLVRNEEMPVFAQLQYIFSREQSTYIWFVCVEMETSLFCSHRHAWKICTPQQQLLYAVDPRSLFYHSPLSLHHLNDGSYIHGLHHRI